MTHSELLKMHMGVYDELDRSERENDALRTLLREQGLSGATIRRKLKAILKDKEALETALHRFQRLIEQIEERLRVIDLETVLRELPLKGRPQ